MPRRKANRCRYGHDMTPANTYTYVDGRTQCRLCHAAVERNRYRRNKGLPPVKRVKESDNERPTG